MSARADLCGVISNDRPYRGHFQNKRTWKRGEA